MNIRQELWLPRQARPNWPAIGSKNWQGSIRLNEVIIMRYASKPVELKQGKLRGIYEHPLFCGAAYPDREIWHFIGPGTVLRMALGNASYVVVGMGNRNDGDDVFLLASCYRRLHHRSSLVAW